MSISTLVGIGVIVIALFYLISIYNKLVLLKNRFKNGFSQIDVQLQRRHDLIPNLVESAKAFMSHEKETLESVISARNQATQATKTAASRPDDASAVKKLMGAENILNKALANFYAVAEAYPDIKANETIQQLMEELSSTENKVSFARQAYNDFVMAYHTYREQFPNNFIAGFFGFKETALFELEDVDAKKAVKVSFN